MMEAIRVRREGCALQETHESFYTQFNILLDAEDCKEGEGISHLVFVLSKRLSVTDIDWQIGNSKIFLRRRLADKLERLALLRVHCAARNVGRFGRLVVERRASILLISWCRFCLQFLNNKNVAKDQQGGVVANRPEYWTNVSLSSIAWAVNRPRRLSFSS